MKVGREWSVLFGVRLTAWRWQDGYYSRWLVFYVGPWRIETEFIRHVEEYDI
jgi:hypothetical protein